MFRSRHKCVVRAENWATTPRTLDLHPSHYAEYTSASMCLLHREKCPSALHRPTNKCCLGKYITSVDYDSHKINKLNLWLKCKVYQCDRRLYERLRLNLNCQITWYATEELRRKPWANKRSRAVNYSCWTSGNGS